MAGASVTSGSSTLPSPTTGGGTNSSTLSEWAGPYVTNMLGQAQASAAEPYQTYQGPLTAGPTALQNQTFQGIGSLAVPSSIGQAANTAGNVATNLSNMSYTPTTFGNQYQAPGAYQPANFTNQYQAPQDYKSVGSTFGTEQAQQYMNPYLQMSLNPQLDEARRQSQITQLGNNAKLTSAGAFGGSRQGIMDAETQRNLGTNLANITGAGYNTAYTNAQQQFNADQTRNIQEAQYAAKQGMDSAALAAQYGLSAAQANELSRQFGSSQGMTAAGLAAQYGLAGQNATEASKQFGTNFGLGAQNAALNAANTQGQLGSTANQANLANLTAQSAAGEAQRGIEQQGITADYNEFVNQRDYPQTQLKFLQSMLQGLPISTVYNTPVAQTSGQQAVGNVTDATALLKTLGVIPNTPA